MIPPLLSQNSRQLVKRFFAREGRLAASSSTSQVAAPSTSQSLTWSLKSNNNPFTSTLAKNSHGHNKFRSAKYSPRRQKKLLKAMEIVKLQEELFKPASSASPEGQAAEAEAEGSSENSFAVPSHWVLPSSPKSKSILSYSSSLLAEAQGPSQVPASTSSTEPPSYTAQDAIKRGPYKGRRNGAFKGHKWERQRESVLADRKEKLASMPERVAEYTKVGSLTHHSLRWYEGAYWQRHWLM
jgi:hypothetical protein